MRISDWSSDGCSADLPLFKLVGAKRYEEQGGQYEDDLFGAAERYGDRKITDSAIVLSIAKAVADVQKKRLLATTQKTFPTTSDVHIGIASCRERVCQDCEITVVTVSIKKNKYT